MSTKNRFPIEGKLLVQLAAIIGKESADKVAKVCKSADFIAKCDTVGEVAGYLDLQITDAQLRQDVAGKAWQWARRLFGEYTDIELLTREDAVIVVGEQYADVVMALFDNWRQVLAFSSEDAITKLFVDAITDPETRNRIAGRFYRYAQRMYVPVSPRVQEGGVNITGEVNVGGDITGGDKIVNQK